MTFQIVPHTDAVLKCWTSKHWCLIVLVKVFFLLDCSFVYGIIFLPVSKVVRSVYPQFRLHICLFDCFYVNNKSCCSSNSNLVDFINRQWHSRAVSAETFSNSCCFILFK